MSKIDYGVWEKFMEDQDVSDDAPPSVVKVWAKAFLRVLLVCLFQFLDFALTQYKLDWNQTRKSIHIAITLRAGEGRKENVMVTFKSQYLFCNLKVMCVCAFV
jgi:hypothetical protein